MSESKEEQAYVRVKDRAGNDFVCPIDALRGLKAVPEGILDNCVDDATIGRYAGNAQIRKQGRSRSKACPGSPWALRCTGRN